ncbi:inner membrane transport protein [Bordetella ansorpii]|uniref:Inner membrane transport protein n=1 Tax=Bordetella ansorpii TaxID=288768 RepID=A0A157NW58_9BORD|nr:MFS transporter [Bordetella ansorpii]SAI25582.1 inner membrane transport protein [Bordetella ansorpii]
MRNEPMQMVLEGLRRRPVLEVTLACLAVLLLAQALIGALSLSALNRLVADTTADRVEVATRQVAGNIENGLRLGKPLGQYFGLTNLLRDGANAARDVQGAVVVVADGRPVAAHGAVVESAELLSRALRTPPGTPLPDGVTRRASGALVAHGGDLVTVAAPLADSAGQVVGAVMLSVTRDVALGRTLLLDNIKVLLLVTLAVGLGLAAAFKYAIPLTTLATGGRARFLVPLAALMLAQGVYAGYTITTFRNASLEVARGNILALSEGLQRDLNRVIGYGIPLDRMRGIEKQFARLAGTFPAISTIDLVQDGRVLNRADANGALPVKGMGPAAETADDLTLVLPLAGQFQRSTIRGSLVMHLSDDVIAAGVRSRVIDAATVVAVALVAAIEMLLLLSLLMNRAFSARGVSPAGVHVGPDDVSEVGRIARPVMFGFLFAWALPLGFLPLYARSLPTGGLDLPANLLLALPISVEMGCGLLTALLAGGLTDRKGWHVPVLAGLAVSFLGLVACAAAPNLPWFAAARGLVGLGYGLTWMGLQGFVVTRSPAQYRGRNMTGVIAGLFAGHLSGAAVGAMLMEQLGFRAVFAVGAVMLVMPLVGVLVLMRPYMQRAAAQAAAHVRRAVPRGSARLSETLRLLFTRDFGLLLLGSVIPFSIAQVGLLSFALPLYLEAEGVAASSIGRVLMIYGVCVIYLGPVMGRLVDRSTSAKKYWIVIGGVLGSAGMLGLYFNSGLVAASCAVLMLALASCFSGASQSPYMLALPDVQQYGAAGATSVLRAADKLGQMAGPLVVGAMFGAAGMGAGLAITGVIYLVATLLFLLFAPARSRQQAAAALG